MSAIRSIASRALRRHAATLRSSSALSLTQQRASSVLVMQAPMLRSEWPSTTAIRSFSKAAKKGKGGKADKPKAEASAAAEDDADGANVAVLLEKTKKNMHGAVLQFTRSLAQMRPGKADAGMFDDLHVQAYGSHVALSQVAQVAVVSSHAVSINIYDPSLLKEVKKVVEGANPVFSVREDATALHVSFPKMSKETREELIKAARKQAEQSRQHVRRVRQDSMNHVKKLKETLPEDDVKKYQDDIQKITDDAIAEIGKLLAAKEKDMVEV